MEEHLNLLISNGKTKEALILLNDLTKLKDKDLNQEVLLQLARFEEYQTQQLRGTSSQNEQNVGITQITHATIVIVGKLFNQENEIPVLEIQRLEKSKKWRLKNALLIAFLAIVVIGASIIFRSSVFTFDLTIILENPYRDQFEGQENIGEILLELENKTERVRIGAENFVEITGIKQSQLGKKTTLILISNYFENIDTTFVLETKSLRFDLWLTERYGEVKGTIINEDNQALTNAVIDVKGIKDTTDLQGKFYILLSKEKRDLQGYSVNIQKENYENMQVKYNLQSEIHPITLKKYNPPKIDEPVHLNYPCYIPSSVNSELIEKLSITIQQGKPIFAEIKNQKYRWNKEINGGEGMDVKATIITKDERFKSGRFFLVNNSGCLAKEAIKHLFDKAE